MIEYFRRRAAANRSTLLRSVLASMPKPVRIVDLGGTRQMWDRWGLSSNADLLITLANNHEYDSVGRDDDIGDDGRFFRDNVDVRNIDVSYYDRFDLIFSNSMLEHLYEPEYQKAVDDSIVASAKPYFVQVPNRNSLIDPHFAHPLAPFFAAWPRSIQARALCVSGLRGGGRMPDIESALKRLDNYVPLSKKDLMALFPNGRIFAEWTAGVPMSLVAVGPESIRI